MTSLPIRPTATATSVFCPPPRWPPVENGTRATSRAIQRVQQPPIVAPQTTGPSNALLACRHSSPHNWSFPNRYPPHSDWAMNRPADRNLRGLPARRQTSAPSCRALPSRRRFPSSVDRVPITNTEFQFPLTIALRANAPQFEHSQFGDPRLKANGDERGIDVAESASSVASSGAVSISSASDQRSEHLARVGPDGDRTELKKRNFTGWPCIKPISPDGTSIFPFPLPSQTARRTGHAVGEGAPGIASPAVSMPT